MSESEGVLAGCKPDKKKKRKKNFSFFFSFFVLSYIRSNKERKEV